MEAEDATQGEKKQRPNDKLRRERELRGWSQKKVGMEIGVAKEMVSYWECGKRETSPYYQEKLCALFGKNAAELGFIEESPITDTSQNTLKAVENALASSFPLQNEDLRNMLPLFTQYISQAIILMAQNLKEQDLDSLRRKLLQQILEMGKGTLLVPLLLKSQLELASPVTTEEFLSQCAASITGCWHLLKGKGLIVAEKILFTLIPSLTTLAFNPSQHQQAAASLMTEAKILQAVLAMHQLNFTARELYCREAVKASLFSADKRLQAAALMYLAYTYTYCFPRKPEIAIDLYLKALHILGNDPCLVHSDIYMGLADAYAQCKDVQKAFESITRAKEHCPTHPENDPSFLYADCGWSELYQWEGRMYLDLAQHYPDRGYYKIAYEAFSQSTNLQTVGERSTSETLILQADAARGLGDLDLYVSCLKSGALMALSLNSHKRYSEAYNIFQCTPEKWQDERQIRDLKKDIFRLPPGKEHH